MALFHKTAARVIPLLLCLCFPGTAPHALQQHPNGQGIGREVRASLEGETDSSGQGAVGMQVAATAQVAASDARTTGDAATTTEEDQNDGPNQGPTWMENGKRDSFTVHTDLKENVTKETKGESGDGDGNARTAKDNEQGKTGEKEKFSQSRDWFTDTLNVTTRPVVTWSRSAAPRRLSPLTTESKKRSQDEQEEEGRQQEEEEDILLTVKFIKEGHPLILDLHPTRDLLAASYKESSGDTSGDDTLQGETRAMPCEYQGVVRGVEQTWVALSVCDGLSGVVAVALEGGEEVELLVEPSPGSTSPHQPHRVFSSTLLNLPERVCGVKDTNSTVKVEDVPGNAATDDTMTNASFSPLRRTRRGVGLVGETLWFEKNTRFVELVLVADHSFYTKHGSRTRSRCKAIVNIVNAVYRPLGVVVVLSHLEVWKDRDEMLVTGDHIQNLERFKEYRKKMVEEKPDYNNDNTMLLTTVDFTGTTVGFAVVSGMCGIAASAGVVQDKQDHVGVVAYTLSHEMGHNFGMNHDEQKCHCDTPYCIMSGSSSPVFSPHISWSSCSKTVIEKSKDSDSFECLRNVPTRMHPSSSCGDGVVDDGEQCDCGPMEFCDNPCCVAATCRFAANASCASGPCCDTKKCQLKPAGVVCREVFTECDLPEFCSGNSESCPDNVIKADGTPCRGRQGYCYEGKCGSHEGQCQAVWGQNARKANLACYSELNKRGGSNGNCGFKKLSRTHLLPCADGDELCGSLQCLPEPNAKPQFNPLPNFASIHVLDYTCYYIISSDTISAWHWLTPDGAKCADGKMCLNQKCVTVPEPAGDCRGGCSGHGVCNSRDHCHCDPGFAPPDCSKEGMGGSIDSNSVGRERYKDPLTEAVFILFLIVLGIAIVLCCLWSHVRRWWEASGRASVPPYCARCLDACCCPLMSLITDRLCTKRKKESVSKEAQDAWEQDKMICQGDLYLKDNQTNTNCRGVANQRLVPEVATLTPKTTPDFRRKIQLPSNHSVHQPVTAQNVDRPTYLQSVSVDSGCISDVEETTVEEPYNSRMSMKSLASVFKMFGIRSSPSPTRKESSPPKTYERQQSMPLRRFVVDPLAGSRHSRHGSPPPNHVKPEWRRSISLEAQSSAKGRPNGAPSLPPPATQKPYGNKDKSPQVCRSTNQREACQADARPGDNGQGVPTCGSKTPPAPSPVRLAPTPPSFHHPAPSSAPRKPMVPPSKKQTPVSIMTQSKDDFPAKTVSPVNAASSAPRKPMVPPSKKQTSVSIMTQSKDDFPAKTVSPVNGPQQNGRGPQNSPTKRPLMLPGRGPNRSPVPMLAKSSAGPSNLQTPGNVPPRFKAGERVKELAKKLEKQ